jgi:hypothetical protein
MSLRTTSVLAGAVIASSLAAPAAVTSANAAPAVSTSAGIQRPQSMQGAKKSYHRAKAMERQARQALERVQQSSAADAAAGAGLTQLQSEWEAAKSRQVWAKRWLLNTKRMHRAPSQGSYRVASQCRSAAVALAECRPPHWREAHLKYDTVVIGRTVHAKFRRVKVVGGWRAHDPYPDHPSGRAADIMMPHGGHGRDVRLGNSIAKYFQKNAREYGVKYMIWRQRTWTAGDRVGNWNGMSSRGSRTANHMDHVHITVKNGHSGNALKKDLHRARAQQS